MSSVPKEIKKVPPKKVYKVRIKFFDDHGAMISRKDFPSIIDSTENSIKWLFDHGFSETDIEIIGAKPGAWGDYFPTIKEEPAVPIGNPADVTAIVPEIIPEPVSAPVAPVAKPVPDSVVDPILQALGVPKAESTVLTETFVPVTPIPDPAPEVAPTDPVVKAIVTEYEKSENIVEAPQA